LSMSLSTAQSLKEPATETVVASGQSAMNSTSTAFGAAFVEDFFAGAFTAFAAFAFGASFTVPLAGALTSLVAALAAFTAFSALGAAFFAGASLTSAFFVVAFAADLASTFFAAVFVAFAAAVFFAAGFSTTVLEFFDMDNLLLFLSNIKFSKIFFKFVVCSNKSSHPAS